MTATDKWREVSPSPATAPRTPYQTPAIDRTPVGTAGRGSDADGVEADWSLSDIPWHSIGKAARGALDAVL
ncbi:MULTISPECIES: hypothetical protein [Streptomyces]|uniref:Uncharacterized protein n=1 Tax=Streptomyces koelreuteriae TaxID=2838015 RepID=A0ABX8G1X0_9ACTN|nr:MULTISPECIES: hypothetical protein [Streptomyces]QWB27361.1 hypothetical protein KJK29_34795 [Streptomyces koelreuteriae]UUA10445.1 hypothetical protein NNW98_34990 [Streptomyces koelreuteriae]UUA18052.1 hypothetical protein NNW99_34875 [Streptomyces sp. CRCS-T-1]